ncbi:MAG: response regulator [Vulcanimicrobiota bacterium]
MAGKIRIIIVEDQTMLRETLTVMLDGEEDFEITGCWADGEEARQCCRDVEHDVAVVDYLLPGMNGIEFARYLLLQVPQVKVIIVSCVCEARIIFEAFEAGVSGYMHKDSPTRELIDAIRAVMNGEKALSSSLIKTYVDFSLTALHRRKKQPLTDEEKEVLILAARGMSNREIALQLKIPVSTVKLRIRSVIEYLNARDRTHAVTKALMQGIIVIDGHVL